MPYRPKRACTRPGCSVLTDAGGLCPACRSKAGKQQDSAPDRKEDIKWYKRRRWIRARDMHLRDHPLCERCEAMGFVDARHLQVHHIKNRKDFAELAYDQDNLETLCRSCHSTETRKRLPEGGPSDHCGLTAGGTLLPASPSVRELDRG